jgi:zinc protease
MKVFRSIVALALFGAVVSAQAPDRSKPPASGPAPALKLPTIVKRQLANGLPAWIVELHEVPVVQVNLLVRAGTANDPPGKAASPAWPPRCSPKAPARDRRWRLPTPSTSWAPT